jgi:hypothetical protein
MVDFIEDDERWMDARAIKMYKPIQDILDTVNWDDYTDEKMMARYEKERIEHEAKMKEKKQELTNIGKRLIEKRKNSTYDKFRKQFSNIYDEVDFKL